jgi:hypothetical protein
MLAEHGQYTRICLQSGQDSRILGGQPINYDLPRLVNDDGRADAARTFKGANQSPYRCGMCSISACSYHVLKKHLASEHHAASSVCLARCYDDFVICHAKAYGAVSAAVSAAATSAAATSAADPAASEPAADDAPETAPHPEVRRVRNFGNIVIIRTRPESDDEAPPVDIKALEAKAYACRDDGPNRDYESFEAGRPVQDNRSVYQDSRGKPFVTHYDTGSLYIGFKYSHIASQDLINAMVHGTTQAFMFFIKKLFEHPYNRVFYKRSASYPLTDVHTQSGTWKIYPDVAVYPRLVESAAAAMRSCVGHLSQTPQFIKVFGGSQDYQHIDHHLYIVGILREPNTLDSDYMRDMLHYYYEYVKLARDVVAEYSEEAEEPWREYPCDESR